MFELNFALHYKKKYTLTYQKIVPVLIVDIWSVANGVRFGDVRVVIHAIKRWTGYADRHYGHVVIGDIA
jgi:hypothetical protein